jgi:predicted Zn-ribbon and HTH transcriptional regulator
MNNEDQLKATAVVMKCKNCGYPTIQSEINEKGGNCPNCNRKFTPLNESSYKRGLDKEP